jgi:hypothetical protein
MARRATPYVEQEFYPPALANTSGTSILGEFFRGLFRFLNVVDRSDPQVVAHQLFARAMAQMTVPGGAKRYL